MKCSKYQAEWQVSTSISTMAPNCPFFSASLAEKNDDSFKRVRSSITKKIIIILFAFLFSLSLYGAEKKYALVIGNADYEDEPLNNPIHDSQDMADALTDVGFNVELLQNADKNTMQETIERFSRTIENADVALLYFAGHGIESDGKNYLLPINMRNVTKASLPDNSISLDYVLHQLRYAEALTNIIILDSCRNSPFLQALQSNSRGLQIVQNPPNMDSFLFFATAPGQIAEDGNKRNSPFTESILENINTPGVEIEQLAKTIRQDVRRKTDNRQDPWSSSNLSTNFYFVEGSEDDQNKIEMITDSSEKQLEDAIELYENDRQKTPTGDIVIELIKELISRDINATSDEDRTPLMLAAYFGYTEIVKALIDNGANIEVKAERSHGFNALMSAAQEGKTEAVKLLIASGANVNEKDNNGQNALMNAAYYGHTEIIKMLITANADVYAKANNEATALYWASHQGHAEIVKLLREAMTYKIGDRGPGGGLVFYIYPDGNKYLECSENLGEGNWDEAMQMAEDYQGGGYDDWELPSKEVLNAIYENLRVNGFISDNSGYWSSSEHNIYVAWMQSFRDGKQYSGNADTGYKQHVYTVRAIRAFNY